MKSQWIENKHNYLHLMIGGKKKKKKPKNISDINECKMVKIGTSLISFTHDLTSNQLQGLKTIKIPTPSVIEKIGNQSIMMNRVVIGDTDFVELDLKRGLYDAYHADDNLIIIHKDLNIVLDQTIKDWSTPGLSLSLAIQGEWKYSGHGVGVDTGTFGFYDLDTIKYIKNNIKEPGYAEANDMPYIDIPLNGYFLVTVAMVQGAEKLKDKINNVFGVIGPTGTGDGGFECYVIGNQMALLVGGYTTNILIDSIDGKSINK